MTITCPECRTAFSDEGLGGRDLVHCPTCGRGIARSTHADGTHARDAAMGPSRTSGLAILSLVCGIASLVAPLCLCPFALMAPVMMAAGAGGGAVVTTPPVFVPNPTVPGTPGGSVTVTLPDGSTVVIDPVTGQQISPPFPGTAPTPVPLPPDPTDPKPADEDPEEGEDDDGE